MVDGRIDLNPVCSKEIVYLPFSIFGLTMAITIKLKDENNLYLKFENPIKPYEGDLPKEQIAPLVNTLYDFIHGTNLWNR